MAAYKKLIFAAVIMSLGMIEATSDTFKKLMLPISAGGLGAEDLKLLEQPEFDINEQDDRGNTLLMYASSTFGGPGIASHLIDLGADITIKNNKGETALSLARKTGNKYIIRLLESKERETKKPFDEQISLIAAIKKNDINTVKAFLAQAGVNVNKKYTEGNTALMEAALEGHKEIVELLIKHKALVNEQNKYGLTALMWATLQGHTVIAELLIKKGALVNQQDDKGNTALMFATAQTSNKEIAELLIKRGADIKIKNERGETALSLAKERGNTQIVKLLEAQEMKAKKKPTEDAILKLLKEGSEPDTTDAKEQFLDTLKDIVKKNPKRISNLFPDQETDAKKFKALLLKWHPDKYKGKDRDFATEVTKLINQAKEKLSGTE